MPKILRIINRLNLGGPTYNAGYLTKYLSPEFETMLVAGMKDDTEESSEFIIEEMGVKARYITQMKREISFGNDRRAYAAIKKIIRDFRPDIVHTHAAKAGALGRLAAAQCNVPVIVHTFHGHVFHSYFNLLKSKLFILAERWLASKSSKIIAISEKQKEELCHRFRICSEDKTAVIPLGFDLTRFSIDQDIKRKKFRQHYGLSDEMIAIGIIGRIVPVKNHAMFLLAVKAVMKKNSTLVKAFIIGDGEDRAQMETHCKNLNLEYAVCGMEESFTHKTAQVIFTSWIKEIDVALSGLDIVALTSLNEGTPVSLIEAQAAGKPVVTTKTGGIENAVIENQTALISEINDVESFSENLLKLSDDHALRNRLAMHGKAFSESKFHYTRLVDDMRKLYNQLLANS